MADTIFSSGGAEVANAICANAKKILRVSTAEIQTSASLYGLMQEVVKDANRQLGRKGIEINKALYSCVQGFVLLYIFFGNSP